MFYKVTADLFFLIPDEANDFYHDCEIALPKSNTINPDQPNQERGYILLQMCYHDEDPTKPCITLNEASTP